MQQKARVFERSMMPVAKQRAQSEEASTCNESAGANRTIIVTLVISSISLFCGYVAGTTQSLSSFQLANQARAAAITLHNQSPVILKYVTPIKSRIELCLLLQQEGFEVGAELGVQRGHFASETLQRWPKCRRYYLVDIWAPQDNYKVRDSQREECVALHDTDVSICKGSRCAAGQQYHQCTAWVAPRTTVWAAIVDLVAGNVC
jgi:hypothetical protein